MSRLAIDQALRAAGWLPANHTNGIELIHILRFGNEHRHAAKRFSPKVRIQSGNDHANALIRKLIDHFYNRVIEELSFIDAYYGNLWL